MLRMPSLFKVPKHRRFEFKTRYYNAEKEAFEERVRAATENAVGFESNEPERKARMKHLFEIKRGKRQVAGERMRMIRLFSIVALLGVLFYLLLK
jgi:hypothetical protein